MNLPVIVPRKVPALRRGPDFVGELVGAFESETLAVFRRTAPVNEHLILYILAAMLLVSVMLTAVVKLDRVVNSVGRIEATAGALYLSPYDTGIIRQIDVKPGEIVKKGQPLATIDPTFTHADLVQLQQHLASDAAAVARAEAELSGMPYGWSETDPYQATQGSIWLKRQAQYRSDLANFDGQIRSAEAQMSQAASDVERYERRLKLAGETENVYQPLLDKGYVSKLQLMQATDARTEMSRLMAVAQSQVAQYRETAAALKAQRDSYINKWHSDTATQMVTDRNDLDLTRDNLEKAQKMQDLTTLDAPTDAIVLKVAKVSSGSVTSGVGGTTQSSQAEPLFTLVPLDAPVEANVNVSAQDIGFIRIGDPVTLKLDAYMFIRHGTAKGVIKSISEGSFTVDDNMQPVEPYFKIRVDIKEVKLRGVPKDFRLIPGMTLVGDIMVDRRTILSYLVEGVVKTGSEAMREPN